MATPFATPRARALGYGLRTAREARRMAMRELARLAGVRPQYLSAWEHGTRVPKLEEVALLLGCLRVAPAERTRLLDLARHVHEPNWLEREIPGVSPETAGYVECERTAIAMFDWQPLLIPGLLQTVDYARAVLSLSKLPTNEVEKRVMIRLKRREVLRGRDPLDYAMVLGEASLRHHIGGAKVMQEQLRHLLAVSAATNVGMRVMPTVVGYHPGLNGPFVLFDFADLPPIVHFEHRRGSAYLYDEQDVADYREDAESIAALALNEHDSRSFVQGVISELEASA